MPIHDWTTVTAGIFHAFHTAWIGDIQKALNAGVLPAGFYALAEQVATQVIPDVLTLQDLALGAVSLDGEGSESAENGGVAVATAPPIVALRQVFSEAALLAARRRRIVIRHTTGDRIVALLEIVSPGNKEKKAAVDQFVDKAIGALDQDLHLQILDLLPPGPFDPAGIHGVICSRMGANYEQPPDKPLTLASYAASGFVTCYVEPTSVGTKLIDMPLFLTPERYVNVPLEATHGSAAYEGVPQRWKRVIEAGNRVM